MALVAQARGAQGSWREVSTGREHLIIEVAPSVIRDVQDWLGIGGDLAAYNELLAVDRERIFDRARD